MDIQIKSAACFLPLIMLASCTRKSEETQHSFRIYEEDGVTIAETTGGPKHSEPIFEFKEAVRLEQDEKRPESLLYRVLEYVMGEDGNFYVLDRGNMRIAVFNSDGKYIRSFGREGDGPGEFRFLKLLWLRDNKLVIYDQRNLRASIFHTNGTFLQSISHAIYSSMTIVYPSTDGQKVLISQQPGPYDGKEKYVEYIATVVGADGDTLAQVKSPMCLAGYRFYYPNSSMMSGVDIFFRPTSKVIYHPDKGIICYHTAEPVIGIHGLDGNLIHEIRIEMEPEPVTKEDRRGIKKYLDEQIESAPIMVKFYARGQKEHAVIADTKSYWASVMVDDAGYFWIQRHLDYSLEKEERNKPSFRVLSPEGEYLGDVILPEERFTISRGHLLTFDRNLETGEATPVVYRIIPAVAGLEYP